MLISNPRKYVLKTDNLQVCVSSTSILTVVNWSVVMRMFYCHVESNALNDLKLNRCMFNFKIYDKRDGFDFDIVNFLFPDGDVPRRTSYEVYTRDSQNVREHF